MNDRLERLPSYTTDTSEANIAVSEFRRNEARKLESEEGNARYDHELQRIDLSDRHKSIYQQPALSSYTGAEKGIKHRRRSRPLEGSTDMTRRTASGNDSATSCEIGKSVSTWHDGSVRHR